MSQDRTDDFSSSSEEDEISEISTASSPNSEAKADNSTSDSVTTTGNDGASVISQDSVCEHSILSKSGTAEDLSLAGQFGALELAAPGISSMHTPLSKDSIISTRQSPPKQKSNFNLTVDGFNRANADQKETIQDSPSKRQRHPSDEDSTMIISPSKRQRPSSGESSATIPISPSKRHRHPSDEDSSVIKVSPSKRQRPSTDEELKFKLDCGKVDTSGPSHLSSPCNTSEVPKDLTQPPVQKESVTSKIPEIRVEEVETRDPQECNTLSKGFGATSVFKVPEVPRIRTRSPKKPDPSCNDSNLESKIESPIKSDSSCSYSNQGLQLDSLNTPLNTQLAGPTSEIRKQNPFLNELLSPRSRRSRRSDIAINYLFRRISNARTVPRVVNPEPEEARNKSSQSGCCDSDVFQPDTASREQQPPQESHSPVFKIPASPPLRTKSPKKSLHKGNSKRRRSQSKSSEGSGKVVLRRSKSDSLLLNPEVLRRNLCHSAVSSDKSENVFNEQPQPGSSTDDTSRVDIVPADRFEPDNSHDGATRGDSDEKTRVDIVPLQRSEPDNSLDATTRSDSAEGARAVIVPLQTSAVDDPLEGTSRGDTDHRTPAEMISQRDALIERLKALVLEYANDIPAFPSSDERIDSIRDLRRLTTVFTNRAERFLAAMQISLTRIQNMEYAPSRNISFLESSISYMWAESFSQEYFILTRLILFNVARGDDVWIYFTRLNNLYYRTIRCFNEYREAIRDYISTLPTNRRK